jgi:DNA uptake protein ComE-like DNA-binding protein
MMMVMMPVMEVQRTHRNLRVASVRPEVKRLALSPFDPFLQATESSLTQSAHSRTLPREHAVTLFKEFQSVMRILRRTLLAAALLFTLPLAITAQKPAKPAAAPAATTDKIDINTATADQLKAIPGIGDAYSKRIIDGRPYTAKNQLVSRGILPQGVYDKIKDQIIANKPAK